MAGPIQTEATIITANAMFEAMLRSAHNQGKGDPSCLNRVLVAIDPGETTGLAYRLPWESGFQIHLKQLRTKEVEAGFDEILAHIPQTDLDMDVVIEDYKVYSWKSDDHKWASLHTPQFIGALRILFHQRPKTSVYFQMAQHAKQWATDEKLTLWGLYHRGIHHARDAERHLITHAFFGKGDRPQNAS